MNNKGKYAVQCRFREWEPWEVIARFDTPQEAQAHIQKQIAPSLYRIAEVYTVERFKAYKGRI